MSAQPVAQTPILPVTPPSLSPQQAQSPPSPGLQAAPITASTGSGIQHGASNQTPQPSSALIRTQPRGNSSVWSKIHTFLHDRVASIGLAIAGLGIVFAVLAWRDSHISVILAEWTSQKDFIEFCTSTDPQSRSAECVAALKTTLRPPPKSSFTHFRRLVKRLIPTLNSSSLSWVSSTATVWLLFIACSAWLLSVILRSLDVFGRSKIPSDELRNLFEITRFSKEELRKWHKGFLKDCPSGQLTREQFTLVYKDFFPFGHPKSFADLVFGVFDTDKSGYIDFKEFIVALSISSRGTVKEKLNWAFQLYDIDRDGFITRNEMLTVVDAVYKMIGNMVKLPEDEDTPSKRVDKLFGRVKTDESDSMNYNDFVELSTKDPTIMSALNLYDGLA